MPATAPRSPSSKASRSRSSRRPESRLGHGETAAGRAASMPGGTPKVARTSLTSATFSSFASFTRGKNSASSRERLPNGLLARQRRKGPRGADHQFDIVPAAPGLQPRLVIHPVNLAIQQHRMFQLGNLAVKPQMHAADGPVLVAAQSAAASASAPSAGGMCGNNLAVASNGSASTRKSDSQLAAARGSVHCDVSSSHSAASTFALKSTLAAALLEVTASRPRKARSAARCSCPCCPPRPSS